MSLMEATFNRSKQFTWIREMPGWCYMALIKSEYRYGYHWPAYPTVAQLAALPHAFRDTLEGAQIVMNGLGTYHVMLDMNYKKPWKTIETMAKGALSWASVGAEPEHGSTDWFMQQIINLNTAITNQTAQLTELNNRNIALQERIHEIEAAPPPPRFDAETLADAFAAAMPAPPRPTAKPSARDPDSFDGTMEKTEAFIMDCQLYLAIRDADYPEHSQRIHWVLGHMTEGTAAIWRENIMNEIRDYDARPTGSTLTHPFATAATETTPARPQHINNPFAKIREDFGDMDQRATRINKLCTIQQGEKKCDEHVQNFRRAALGSGYNDVSLIEEFKRSLNVPIRRKLMESENPPTTLSSWYERAITVDRNWRQFKAEETMYQKREGKKAVEPAKGQPKPAFQKWTRPTGNPRPSTNQNSFNPRPTSTFTPRPNANTDDRMEVDRARRPPMKCYACGKLGHMARNCKSSRQVRQAWTERMIAAADAIIDAPQGRIEEVADEEETEQSKDTEGQ